MVKPGLLRHAFRFIYGDAGEGKPKITDEKQTTVYKRALDVEYRLKMAASRQVRVLPAPRKQSAHAPPVAQVAESLCSRPAAAAAPMGRTFVAGLKDHETSGHGPVGSRC